MTRDFARNLEMRLKQRASGTRFDAPGESPAPELNAGTLLLSVGWSVLRHSCAVCGGVEWKAPQRTRIALSLVVIAHASAQSYPSKSIRLIAPYPPGGGIDSAARIIGQALSEQLGRAVLIIYNRAGATGRIGTELAAKSPADGYTLLLGSSAPNAIIPAASATVAAASAGPRIFCWCIPRCRADPEGVDRARTRESGNAHVRIERLGIASCG